LTIHVAEGITLEEFNPLNKADVDSLQSMFTDYLLEEFERIGELAFGNPAAGYLITTFIGCDGQTAGFMSLDAGRRAVELIYITPKWRGRGVATQVLRHTDRACPEKLALKTPLSPGGSALADRLDLARADNFPHEVAKNEEALRIIREGIKRTCTHGQKAGDPRKSCRRCYQKSLRRIAAYGLAKHVAEVQARAAR
jgi:GNAT superfamily N-acetyltransferase